MKQVKVEMPTVEIPANVTWKWTINPTDIPGPRQVKAFNEAVSKVKWNAQAIEADGFHTVALFSNRFYNLPMLEAYGKLCERHANVVGKKMIRAITDEILTIAAMPKVKQTYRDQTQEEIEQDVAATKAYEEANKQRAAEAAKSDEMKSKLLATMPVNATALIVAEEEIDACDIMTDYFSVKTNKRVAIGWRTGPREDFKQLRRAAGTYEPTKHLQDAPATAEHRDNYSMGGGNYLKATSRYSTGWTVRSVALPREGSNYFPQVDEIAIPVTPVGQVIAQLKAEAEMGTKVEVVKQFHSKRNCDIWTVVLVDRVSPAAFNTLTSEAKRMGGWYYRDYAGNKGGFHFANEADANTFAATVK